MLLSYATRGAEAYTEAQRRARYIDLSSGSEMTSRLSLTCPTLDPDGHLIFAEESIVQKKDQIEIL